MLQRLIPSILQNFAWSSPPSALCIFIGTALLHSLRLHHRWQQYLLNNGDLISDLINNLISGSRIVLMLLMKFYLFIHLFLYIYGTYI